MSSARCAMGPRRRWRRIAVSLIVGLACACAAAAPHKTKAKARPKAVAVRDDRAPDVVTYGRRDDVMRFAAEVAEARGLDRAWVEATLAEACYLPSVAKLVMPPPVGTAKDWSAYRARFVEPQRIRAGLEFWAVNERWLAEAERRWGVPPEIVVGLIGVETFYGRLTGSFRVLDALATLAFDFPPGRKDRSVYFRSELANLLVLAQRERLPAEAIKGSYAGAIGLGQFMPGSILRYGIDVDGDGRVDMQGSAADVIGSVAHYLASYGWRPGMRTHYAVLPPLDTTERALLLVPDIVPTFSAAELADHGAELEPAGRAHDGPLALVELQNGSAAPSHVAGTQNFYVLTRYNWSAYYALAVIELGRAVKARRVVEAADSASTPAVGVPSAAGSAPAASAALPAAAAQAPADATPAPPPDAATNVPAPAASAASAAAAGAASAAAPVVASPPAAASAAAHAASAASAAARAASAAASVAAAASAAPAR